MSRAERWQSLVVLGLIVCLTWVVALPFVLLGCNCAYRITPYWIQIRWLQISLGNPALQSWWWSTATTDAIAPCRSRTTFCT